MLRRFWTKQLQLRRREAKYYRLLRIAPHPVYTEARLQVISKRHVEGNVSWLFRWIYTFTDGEGKIQRKPRWTLKTLNGKLKKGKIKVNKIFKRASYTDEVSIETPKKWVEEWVDP